MSRLLRFNKYDVDIDDDTAIGINLQCYDVKEPGKRLANITESFTLPLTANNKRLFGFADNPQSKDKTIYSALNAEYWNGAAKLIDNGKVRIDEISDRASIYLVDKNSIWDDLKLITWPQFAKEYVEWINPEILGYEDLITSLIDGVDDLLLPCYMGQLMRHQVSDTSAYTEDAANIWMQFKEINGGHLCVYAKNIFRFIEQKYGVEFYSSGGVFPGNIWDDQYISNIYTPIRNLGIKANYNSLGVNQGFSVAYIDDSFLPLDCGDKTDKTLSDFVNSFFQHFNVLKDEVDGSFRLYRWDDLENAPVIDWSNKLSTDKRKFRPSVSGFNQNNYIKFSSIYEGGDSLVGSRNVTCQNKNLDAKGDLFTIDANIPEFVQGYGGVIPDLSLEKSFETFQFFITGYESEGVLSRTTATIAVNFDDGVTQVYIAKYLQIPSVYSINNEYKLLEKILQYPVYREVSAWLTINDILKLRFFAQYYFKELGGSYFLNKITGFNPDKSKIATKLELIKISDKSPVTPPDVEYYVDGVNDGFTDGVGDLFY